MKDGTAGWLTTGAGTELMPGAVKVMGAGSSLYSDSSRISAASIATLGCQWLVPRVKTAAARVSFLVGTESGGSRRLAVAKRETGAGFYGAHGALQHEALRLPQRHKHLQADELHRDGWLRHRARMLGRRFCQSTRRRVDFGLRGRRRRMRNRLKYVRKSRKSSRIVRFVCVVAKVGR